MQVSATAKYIHTSPRKVRLVADLIRGKSIVEARNQLTFSKKAAAKLVLKALNSAVANAEHNNSADTSDYIVSEIRIDEAPTIKRFRPRARGAAFAIRKRTCHIKVTVGPKAGAVEKQAPEATSETESETPKN